MKISMEWMKIMREFFVEFHSFYTLNFYDFHKNMRNAINKFDKIHICDIIISRCI